MKKVMILVFAFIFTLSTTARADLDSQVQQMFDRLGFSNNVTTPGVYEAQTRGYVTGGAISLRTPYDVLQPFSVSLPSVRSGCQGIDVFLGGFSYINLEQLIEKLKAIGTSALSYGFMLAIKKLCSSCGSVMEFLESASRAANSMAMDTCRAGETIAKGVFGEGSIIRAGQFGRCALVGSASGGFKDFIEAWTDCANDVSSAMSSVTGEEAQRANPEGNLVWNGLRELPLSDEMREYIMSTMGTVIILKDQAEHKAPVLNASDLLNGGTVQVYRCADAEHENCTQIEVEEVSITGFKSRVKEQMEQAFQHIITRTEPDEATKKFIESLPAPAWKFLNVVSGYTAPVGYSYIEQYSDSIAVIAMSFWFDMALRYTIQAISLASYKGAGNTLEATDSFYEKAKDFYDMVYKEMDKAEKELNNFDSMLQTLEFLEKKTTELLEAQGIISQYRFGKEVNRLQAK